MKKDELQDVEQQILQAQSFVLEAVETLLQRKLHLARLEGKYNYMKELGEKGSKK